MSAAGDRVRSAKTRLRQLRRDCDRDIAEARASIRTMTLNGETTDADTQTMTVRQIERERDSREAAVVARYAAQFTALEQDVREDSERLQRDAIAARPQLGDDARSWSRMSAAWDGVKARLEAGTPVSTILRDADEITTHAISEWAPAYLQAQHEASHHTSGVSGLNVNGIGADGLLDMSRTGYDAAPVHRAVDARLAQLHEAYGTAHAEAVEAEGVAAYVVPLVDSLTDSSGGPQPTGLAGSIGAHYAEQAVQVAAGIDAADSTPADAGEGAA